MFKVNNEDTKTTPLALFWCLYSYFWTYFTPCSSVSIVNFEQINAVWDLRVQNNVHGWRDPADIYLFKFNNRNIRTKCEKSLKLTTKFWTYFPPFPSFFLVDFEHVNVCWIRESASIFLWPVHISKYEDQIKLFINTYRDVSRIYWILMMELFGKVIHG